MKKLHEIIEGISVQQIVGNTDIDIEGITADSRTVKPGFLFIAVNGYNTDGHQFINHAIQSGAACILLEKIPQNISLKIPFIICTDSAEALGIASHNFFDKPSHKLKLIGITGTNGKTTVATLCYNLFENLGIFSGLLSTVENKIHDATLAATHTTPDTVQLNRLLAQMVVAGCEYVFMEVSSHAAHQKRIAGLQFTGAVFTNITQDHLDYHKTFDNYIYAKKSFFDGLSEEAFALVNIDDRRGKIMLQNCKASKHTYSVKGAAEFECRIMQNSLTGLILKIEGEEFHTPLIGEFNAWNILAVYAVARIFGYDKNTILKSLSKLHPVEGRFDVVYSPAGYITAIIDYAHTPDAVEKILSTLRNAIKNEQHIITVIGCGGNRDKTKRPLMAKTAAVYSEKLILTSDNPRSEEALQIIHEMEAGLENGMRKKTISIIDRREAIKTAVMLAQKNDVILIAGKGHEKYQEINGIKYPFDDKHVILETFKTLLK